MFEQYGNMNYASLNGGDAGFGQYESLPDGRYQVVIESLSLGESQKGFPMVRARFSVVNHPQFNTRAIFANYVVLRDGSENDRGLVAAAMQFLTSLGCGPVQLSTIPALASQVDAIAGECVRGHYNYIVELKTSKKGYQSTNIVERPAR